MFNSIPKNSPQRIVVGVSNVEKKTTKGGKAYHLVTLASGSARQAVSFWDNGPTTPPVGAIIRFSATWAVGDYGLEAKNFTWTEATESECTEFLNATQRPATQKAMEHIDKCIAEFREPYRTLAMDFLARYRVPFMRAAAARQNHQAFPGGLAEHTSGMLALAHGICRSFATTSDHYYGGIKPDLSLIQCAILFHDCGKIWENNYNAEGVPLHMPYRRLSEMHGHIAIGAQIVLLTHINSNPSTSHFFDDLPEDIHHLIHCILSHHGQLDWGSPIEPKSLEALIVHAVDNIEAKSWMLTNVLLNGEALPENLHKGSFGPIRTAIATIHPA